MERRKSAEGLIEDEYPSVFCYTYPRGTVFEEHTHPADTMDAVMEEDRAITIEGEEFLLRAGDMIEVPSRFTRLRSWEHSCGELECE